MRGIKLAREWSTSQAQVKKGSNLSHTDRSQTRDSFRGVADENRVTCKTDAAWNKDNLMAGLAWIFSGQKLEVPIKGSVIEHSIGSPLIAEASAMRSALCMAITLEITALDVFSDNLTLVRAISGITQVKEIIGIVKDIRSISTELASFSFSHFSRSLNAEADALAKETLRASLSL